MTYQHPFVYMFSLAMTHPFWSGVVLYWLYSAAVDNLPDPNGNLFYRWFYGFLHSIAGNLRTAFGNKIPGVNPNGGSK